MSLPGDALIIDRAYRRTHAPLVFKILAALLPIFALATVFYPIQDNWAIGIFLWSVLVLAFAILPASNREADLRGIPFYDWIAIAGITFTIGYYIYAYEYLNLYIGAYTTWQYGVMAAAILLSMEAARRAMGFIVPLIAAALIVWALWGGFPSSIVLTRIYVGGEGMFGTLTDVFLRYVFLFFIFGALMEHAGASSFLRRYLRAVAGRSTAASAKATMLGSGLLGMFMGSGAGNVAVTGSLTIPMMKQEGYSPEKAAGIEAASGLGGELSPPIMGSAIFLLVAYTATPYREVALLSILPAILYYLPIYLIVHFEGKRDKTIASVASSGEKPLALLRTYAHLALAPIVLVALIAFGFSPTYAGAGGIVAALVLSQIQRVERLTLKDAAKALTAGTMNFVTLGAAAPVLATILVIVLLIGLPSTMTSIATGLAGGNILLVLFGTFVLALVLGMGMPIVAAYMILATVVAPALTQLSVPLLTAHLCILWFTETGALTPPVALASYVAATIAGTTMWRTALQAMRLAISIFVVPFVFVFTGILSDDPLQRSWSFLLVAGGLAIYAALVSDFVGGRLNWPIRIGLVVLVVGLAVPVAAVNIIAFILTLAFFAWRLIPARPEPGRA